jgi:division protein CdvB (Snf7/Vps24/ESCRT-III family)
MEEDRNALEHIINEIVTKCNNELKQQRQKLQIDSLKRNAGDITLSQKPKSADPSGEAMMSVNPRISPHIISDTLAAFVLRSVAMSPEHNFNVDMEFTADEVERLIRICVERITRENLPEMETVKMQVYFDTHFPAQCIYYLLH